MIKMWTLLQQERAEVELVPGEMSGSIHSIPLNSRYLDRLGSSKAALIRAMGLPAPLLEMIASFMPLPFLWDRRISLINKRLAFDPDSSISCTFDVIDEILEEGDFTTACDIAGITAPTGFDSWGEWKSWGRKHDKPIPDPVQVPRRRTALGSTLAGLPHLETTGAVGGKEAARKPQSSIEQRRGICFLQILAHRSPVLVQVLSRPPYNMPDWLLQQVRAIICE
jgi:hypothetical protein